MAQSVEEKTYGRFMKACVLGGDAREGKNVSQVGVPQGVCSSLVDLVLWRPKTVPRQRPQRFANSKGSSQLSKSRLEPHTSNPV